MRACIVRRAGCSAVLATALALAAPPSPADTLDLRAVSGLPEASPGAGRGFAWRKVGVVAESDYLDVDARVVRCVDSAATTATPSGLPGSTCAGVSSSDASGSLGNQYGLTFKLPQLYEGGPWIDATFRSWRGAAYRSATVDNPSTGSSVGLTVSQQVGSFEAIAGHTLPVAHVRAEGVWRASFAGVVWRPVRGTAFEFMADRGLETATGTIDRTLTLKMWQTLPARGLRFGLWGTRALDDPAERLRVGAGLEASF